MWRIWPFNVCYSPHKVTQYKKGKDSLFAQGKRRYDRKQSGYGGQTKPVFHKKVCPNANHEHGWYTQANVSIGKDNEEGCIAVGVYCVQIQDADVTQALQAVCCFLPVFICIGSNRWLASSLEERKRQRVLHLVLYVHYSLFWNCYSIWLAI